jgi:hypothetical protein
MVKVVLNQRTLNLLTEQDSELELHTNFGADPANYNKEIAPQCGLEENYDAKLKEV